MKTNSKTIRSQVWQLAPRLPDKNFNKKPNSAKKRPEKGQIKLFRPTNLKQSNISEIWPKKGQSGNCDLLLQAKEWTRVNCKLTIAWYQNFSEQWTWFLCSVGVKPANKPSLKEIGIELLILSFSRNFWFSPKCPFCLRTPMVTIKTNCSLLINSTLNKQV